MKLIDLLNAANEGYPDNFLAQYYNPETGEFDYAGSGDTLAQFIVHELIETFDDKGTDDEQIDEAERVLERAQADIAGVIFALNGGKR